MDNLEVWVSLNTISGQEPPSNFVRSLTSLASSELEFINLEASALRNGISCQIDRTKFSFGAFNVSFPLLLQDGVRWLLRVRAPSHHLPPFLHRQVAVITESTTSQMLQSSIDTIRYIKENWNLLSFI